MAKKRALVDAVLTVTAASDIFTQDIEDIPEEILNKGEKKPEPPKEEASKPAAKPKEDFAAICKREFERLGEMRFYEVLNGCGVETVEEIVDRPKQIEVFKALSAAK